MEERKQCVLKVGDVFTAPALAKAQYRVSYRDGRPFLDQSLIVVGQPYTQEARWTERSGEWSRPRKDTYELNADDPSRGEDWFVVEEIGEGQNNFGQVFARRLLSNGEYDEEGERVCFREAGSCNDVIEEVRIVGKMQRTFVWQGGLPMVSA
jgi:hypothetical protein